MAKQVFNPLTGSFDLILNNIDELADVNLTAVADNDLLQFNSSSGDWENITVAALAPQISHSGLADLDVPADHIEFLLLDGTRPMVGDFIPDLSGIHDLGTALLGWDNLNMSVGSFWANAGSPFSIAGTVFLGLFHAGWVIECLTNINLSARSGFTNASINMLISNSASQQFSVSSATAAGTLLVFNFAINGLGVVSWLGRDDSDWTAADFGTMSWSCIDFTVTPSNDFTVTPGNDFVANPTNDFIATPTADFSVTCVDFIANPSNDFIATPTVDFTITPGNDFIANPSNDFIATPTVNFSVTCVDFIANPSNDFIATPSVDFNVNPGNDFIATPTVDFTVIPGNDFTVNPGNDFIATPSIDFIVTPGNDFLATPTNDFTVTLGNDFKIIGTGAEEILIVTGDNLGDFDTVTTMGSFNSGILAGIPLGSIFTINNDSGGDNAKSFSSLIVQHDDNSGFGVRAVTARSRGTAAAQTAVASGNALYRIACYGHDGTDYTQAGAFSWDVTNGATVTDNDVPSIFRLSGSKEGDGGLYTILVADGSISLFNEPMLDIDFAASGNTDVDLFYVNAGTDRVGIGTNAPAVKLDVIGAVASYDGIDLAAYAFMMAG